MCLIIADTCLIIADNFNVHSFSLKPFIFCKKVILVQNWPFKENLLYLNKGFKFITFFVFLSLVSKSISLTLNALWSFNP
jgi:hypothetical protein